MRTAFKLLALLSIGLALTAQSAEVFELQPSESTNGKILFHAAIEAMEKYAKSAEDYNKWKNEMTKKYLKNGQAGDFDSNFKHILPIRQLSGTSTWCPMSAVCGPN